MACAKNIENKEAVRQGVIEAVAGKVNLTSMDVDITAVTFKGDTAEATADFRAKGAAPGTGIQMRYTLENKAGKWVVKQKAESGANPHGAATPMPPPGGPPPGNLPPGHPPMPSGQPKAGETKP